MDFSRVTYPNKGEVTFLGDSLYQWREPKW